MALVFEDTDIDKSVEDSIAQSKYDSILRKNSFLVMKLKEDIDGTIFHPNSRHYLEGVRCNAQGEIGYYNGFKLGPLPIVEIIEELTLEHTNELSIIESNVQYISKMYLKNIDIKTIRPLLDSLLKVDRLHLQPYSFLNYKFSDVNQFIELIKKCSCVAMELMFYTGEEFLKEYEANIKKFCVRNPKRK